MDRTEKIFNDIQKQDAKELILDFEKYLKKKNKRLGFQEQLIIIEYLLIRNNKLRGVDKAIISFRKLK